MLSIIVSNMLDIMNDTIWLNVLVQSLLLQNECVYSYVCIFGGMYMKIHVYMCSCVCVVICKLAIPLIQEEHKEV